MHWCCFLMKFYTLQVIIRFKNLTRTLTRLKIDRVAERTVEFRELGHCVVERAFQIAAPRAWNSFPSDVYQQILLRHSRNYYRLPCCPNSIVTFSANIVLYFIYIFYNM